MDITLNGKKFEFTKPTVAFIRALTDSGYGENLKKKFTAAIQDTEECKKFSREWKSFCLFAFKKKWWWRIYFPKDLAFNNLTIVEAAKTIRNFFDFVRVILDEFTALAKPSTDSKEK